MKTTQECWQALIDGETLKNIGGATTCLVNGMVFGGWSFKHPEHWSIYTPPKWYDNIPEGGVLCWCWDNLVGTKVLATVVKKHGKNYPFKTPENEFKYAAPITKQEIQVLLDNAPEGEGE